MLACSNPVVQVALTLVAGGMLAWGGVLGRLSPGLLVRVPLIVVVVSLFLRHPKWCVVGVIVATVFGLYRRGLEFGTVDIRPADVPWAFLVGWAVLLRARHGPVRRALVGQPQLGLFLVVLGFSLSTQLEVGLDPIVPLVVSLLRLATTMSLVWLVPYAIRSRSDRLFLLRAMVMAGVAELAHAEFLYFRAGGLGTRLEGSNGPNAEALIAVVVLLSVLNLPLFSRRARVMIGAVGILAVALSTSIAAVTALAIVVGVYGLRATAERSARAAAFLRPARILLVATGAVLLVVTLRPRDAPTSEAFNTSSTAQRVVFGYAGLQIFVDHPILGVGWQRSSSSDVIGSGQLVKRVRERFTEVRSDLLPGAGGTATVHNFYIQVLAESGLVGISVLVFALFAGVRGVRAVVANAGPDAALALCLGALLMAILVWWNDNPLFGAQPETVMFAFFLGLLASLAPDPPAGAANSRFSDGRRLAPGVTA